MAQLNFTPSHVNRFVRLRELVSEKDVKIEMNKEAPAEAKEARATVLPKEGHTNAMTALESLPLRSLTAWTEARSQTRKSMDKNHMEGRPGLVSWHNTASAPAAIAAPPRKASRREDKPSGLARQVNAAIVRGRTAFLPGGNESAADMEGPTVSSILPSNLRRESGGEASRGH